jgi:ketosteroid isomerase-like protein
MEINKQHVALVEEFWKHLGNNDLDSALGLWTDDARWWLNGDGPVSGWIPKEQFLAWGRDAFPDMFPSGLRMNLDAIWTVDDTVITQSSSEGLHKNGKIYKNCYVHFFKIVNARISELKEYTDTILVDRLLNGWE